MNFEGNEYNTRWLDISQSKVKNGGLNADASGWTLPQSVTTATYTNSVDNGLSMTLSGTTQNWWDDILQQGELPLEAGKTYRLSFDASSSAPKTMQVVVSKPDSNDVKYLEQ